jgi:hypothetical protein
LGCANTCLWDFLLRQHDEFAWTEGTQAVDSKFPASGSRMFHSNYIRCAWHRTITRKGLQIYGWPSVISTWRHINLPQTAPLDSSPCSPNMLAFLAPFFLLSATVLLLLVSLSVPIIKSINLFTLDAHASGSIGDLGDAGVTAYADFGVWGYCVSSLDVKLVCLGFFCHLSMHGPNRPILALLV